MRIVAGTVGLLAAAILAGSCSSNETTAGAGAGGPGAGAFRDSACGTCAGEKCQESFDGCNADPGCAAYLTCLLDCPTAASGFVDEACADTCPIADSSATQKAIHNVQFCLERGDGADYCLECGKLQTTDPDLEQTCSASMETNVCWKCEDEKCCKTYQRCKDNPECDALVMCVQACNPDDDPCFATCYDTHPDGLADYGARLGCVLILCLEECATPPISPCASCTAANCPDEYMACNKQPDCFLFTACVATCPDTPDECVHQCLDMYPAAEDNAIAFGACGNVECIAECGG